MIPGQSQTALGLELLGESLVAGTAIVVLARRSLPQDHPQRQWLLARQLVSTAGALPFVVGGATLIAGTGGGLYWIAAGMIFAIAGAVANAWVLMVEILR